MGDLVRELDERAAAQHAPAVAGVTLASLHAAKGLEWDTVFIVGCSDGFLPIVMAEGEVAIEEERRLFYVGLTRARRDLQLSWSGARTPGARATRRPSRFLDPAASILGEGARSAPRRSGVVGGSGSSPSAPRQPRLPSVCRGCGTELTTAATRKVGRCEDCPPTYDEATFEALRVWRGEVAKTMKVPAYVVFTDATLTALAETAPTDLRGVAGVSGVGAMKLDRYGGAVLDVLAGGDPHMAAEKTTAAMGSDNS
jgi:DNA helicase-2/ATP-dependent DNA helicase PcrA